ncbi:DUF5132 domain-containing protein [Paenibacillus oleatilyticus]|uniref:DUF5132 domain-containing protein n=1 Tax=Paenibacillus oleatilyticus TaxID=2594886 RepID=UPI001C1FB0B4|nr:DUF5132 domain-containing protein [Paenibacillus oleatilyticus]MBU7316294.1 DUF5132 domain-containing protein [Paenibacillus oleatilyticus]
MREQLIEKWLVGAALAFAVSTLLPVVKTTLLPVAEAGYQGLRSAAGAARSSLQEAQVERMKKKAGPRNRLFRGRVRTGAVRQRSGRSCA